MTRNLEKQRSSSLPVAQFVAIVVLTVSIFLVVDFGRRATANYQAHRDEQALRQKIHAEKERQAELLARLEYASSDAYVEEAARNHLRWAREGETLVVVIATPLPPADSTGDSILLSEGKGPQTPLEAWWHMLFAPRY